jgi:hypothetical protein
MTTTWWIEQWLINVIINVMARSENVLENVVLINTLPLELATSYHNIYMCLKTIFECQV